jgi:hypothetical protein
MSFLSASIPDAHQKNPRRGQAKGAFHPDLLAVLFSVARNPVTNRHVVLLPIRRSCEFVKPDTCNVTVL